jgi:hypothetical protein
MLDGFVKSPYAALHFILRHCNVPVGATLCGRPKPGQARRPAPTIIAHARLAFGTFYCVVSASALREIAHA